MLTYFARLMRENFMFNFGIDDLVYMSEMKKTSPRTFARFVNEQNIVEISELIDLLHSRHLAECQCQSGVLRLCREHDSLYQKGIKATTS